jgi:hypothetical protein
LAWKQAIGKILEARNDVECRGDGRTTRYRHDNHHLSADAIFGPLAAIIGDRYTVESFSAVEMIPAEFHSISQH